jgi:ATP/maltotriose-dependent transcriptional regulator MalT
VLDDYHVIEAPPAHEAITFLLDHLSSQSAWSSQVGRIRRSRWIACELEEGFRS